MATTKERAAAAGAKTPNDHAVKTEASSADVTVEVRGFTLTFDPNDFDDDELLTGLDKGRPDEALMVVTGDDDDLVDKIAAELRNDPANLNGRGKLKRSALVQFIGEVMEAAGQGKS